MVRLYSGAVDEFTMSTDSVIAHNELAQPSVASKLLAAGSELKDTL